MMISKKFIMCNSVEQKEQYEMGILTEEKCWKTKGLLELIIKKQLGQSPQGGKIGRKYVALSDIFKEVLYQVSQSVLTGPSFWTHLMIYCKNS